MKRPVYHHHEDKEEEIEDEETSPHHHHHVVIDEHKLQQHSQHLVHSPPINTHPEQHFHHMYNGNNNDAQAVQQAPVVATPVVDQQSVAVHLGSVEIQPNHSLLQQQQQQQQQQVLVQPVAAAYQQPVATTLIQQPEQYATITPQSMYPQPAIVASPYTPLTDANAAIASHYTATAPTFEQTQTYVQAADSQVAAFSSQGRSDSTNNYYGENPSALQYSDQLQQQQQKSQESQQQQKQQQLQQSQQQQQLQQPQQKEKQQETSERKMKGMYLLPSSTSRYPSPYSHQYYNYVESHVSDHPIISPGARL